MTWTEEAGSFVLIGFPQAPEASDFACLSVPPAQILCEEDETTLLVREDRAAEVIARHPGARVERDLVWVRFETPMGWEVVGFLALVSGELAKAGVPIGAVSGFSRDHVFVARERLATVAAVLDRLFPTPPRSRSAG